VRIKIEELDEKGRGVGDDLHIPFAYPGDVVEARLINKRKKTGKLLSLVEPSPCRQNPLCPHFGACGGCAWQGLKYEAQLKFKEEKVKDLFGECSPILPSPEIYFYRNRMDYAFGPNFSIGLKDGRDNIIDIEKCLLMSKESNAILNRLRYFISLKKLEAYKAGIMRHVVIREGKNIKNTILNILTSDKGEFPLEELWENIKDLIQGSTWGINLSPADRSYGEIQKTLGQDHLIESLAGLKFKVPVQSFFQTNTHQAEKLLEIVKDFAGLQGDETLLDLYAGTGSIGLSLADKARKVIGIEENQSAVELSKTNAELNGIDNFSAMAGRVEDLLGSLEGKFEVMILDPPRPGIHKKALKKIGEIKPGRIVYVSCNPLTQKQDVETLKAFGYGIKKRQPLDMFPHTPHIENILLLS
jgi:23S rRNA (uracil-5-)-methyltransferase RumA